ncbi:protein spire homolog 1-like isoform X2 [Mizuhopecten yessoensis]|uniref:Protein spire-like 1 n=1 Tax=Mizuhopecten yessoensis TaxID=6573 RepID=A0A210PEA2_MIZYE|nr:protein spire homolog 1-like isoform X2 [Mizuhopecten yessoensis]OWF34786.1 Protein spire-like 1 [Mizuhopecten yessoensis]
MAQTSPKGSSSSKQELLSLKDILTVFNNPINEDQAWAVCHQCAQFFQTTSDRSKYREFYKHGARAIRIRPGGEILIEVAECDISLGSGKGPPLRRRNSVTGKDIKVVTESDAVQGLGLVIYQALDYGMGAAEERHLSLELESLVEFMTNPDGDEEDASTADDEGIEKDAKESGLFPDVLAICEQHLSNEVNPGNHYRAVCRALVAEAQELCSFLEQISTGKESLNVKAEDDLTILDDLQRNDWARLWVQIMKQLRHGVRLKSVEHTNLTPREYELTPFEVLLEDIRTRRYNLKKTVVNGDIPLKVKSDAHAVILDFIRSRPPLHSVKDRILKSPPKRQLDPVELLLQDIRQQPKLRPVKDGKLVVETSRTKLNNADETESPLPVRKVIKPDFNLLRNFEDDTDESECSLQSSRRSSVASPSPEREMRPWQRAVVRDLATTQSRPVMLQRRNTITVCESPAVQVYPTSTPQSPILEETDEENVFPQKAAPIKSPSNSHDIAVKKIRRQSAVCKSHVSANDVRQRLSLKLHGNTPAMCMSSQDRVHGRANLSSQSSGSYEDLLSDSSSQSSPRMRKVSEPLLSTYQQKVQRSVSVSDMAGNRPQPMTRSRTMPKVSSELETSEQSGVSDETNRPVPRPRPVPAPRLSRSSSPLPTQQLTSPAVVPTSIGAKSLSPLVSQQDASPTPARRETSPKPVKRHRSSVHRSSTQREHHRHRLNSSEEEQPSELSSDKTLASEQKHRSSERRQRSSEQRQRSSEQRQRSSERKQSSAEHRQSSSEHRQHSSERRQRSSERNQTTDSKSRERKQRTSERRIPVDMSSEVSSVPSTPSTSTSSSVVSSPSRVSPDASPKPSPTPRPRIQRSSSHHIKRQMTISGGPVPTADTDQTIPKARDSTRDSPKISIRKESSSEFGRMTPKTDSAVDNPRVPRRSGSSRTPRPMSLIEADDRHAIIQEAAESSLQTNGASSFSSLDVRDLLNVSSRMKSSGAGEDHASTTNCNGSPTPSSHPSSAVPAAAGSKWSHPIECLSLTLEEVTHIRTVLTKADLETVITQKDLYTLLAKGKICFTCKEVKFSMFGQWGTRCKICKRNVCNNCLRKMNVPTEHFENIPVHTLSPIPLSPETLDIIRAYESTGSVPHSPTLQRKQQQRLETKSVKPKTLQRANTFTANQGPAMLPNKNLLKGPQMNICRDCKGMIMEIIRTSRTSIALINQGKELPKKSASSSSDDGGSGMNLSSLSLNVKHFFAPTKE